MSSGTRFRLGESRRTIVPAALVLVTLIAAAAWWLSGGEDLSPIAGSGTEAPQRAPVLADSSSASASEPVSRGTIAPELAKADDEIEVCGGQWLKVGADGQPAEAEAAEMLTRAIDEVASMALATMSSSGSPVAQAAARYLRSGRADVAATMGANCDSPACTAVWESWRRDGQGQREALAQLAQTSDDAQVYAWAYRACQGVSSQASGSCLAVTAARWAQLDSGNAEPWLAVASEARARKDAAAFDDAMFHVASADRHDPGWGALSAEIIDHVPPDDANLLGLAGLMAQTAAVETLRSPAWSQTSQYCSEQELGDSNRREVCERIATVLADRSTTLLARSVGEALGKRVGWPAERVAATTLQRDAEAAVTDRQVEQAAVEPMACGPLRVEVERMRDIARYGEIEVYRRQIAATGKPVAELAAEGRRRRAEDDARAAQTAAAASAAAASSAASGANVALR